ncbi:hypothetical protein K431DRAFT_105704 [Polychaeton citri CBS 116435]|uniref:Uncharacterized protein n=1 Tax=Polychaeton citri CBS 116435 TaxID=1314669 RepID=A0A9P4Q7M8_9PEZI|nr:hypothetical protein K431DRAFT_105704 [Polychaeton citri CBS 116435]
MMGLSIPRAHAPKHNGATQHSLYDLHAHSRTHSALYRSNEGERVVRKANTVAVIPSPPPLTAKIAAERCNARSAQVEHSRRFHCGLQLCPFQHRRFDVDESMK